MEVFLSNVPHDLTRESLTEELSSFLSALNISDWCVRKSYKKNFATITFLHADDGAEFLVRHGTIPGPSTVRAAQLLHKPRDIAKLHITKTPIYARKSELPPNMRILGRLQLVRDKRAEREARIKDGSFHDKFVPLIAAVREIALGKNVFAGADERLTFCQQSSLPLHGTAKFASRRLMITLSGLFRIDIPYDSIKFLIADHSQHALVLVLTEPPKFHSIVTSTDNRKRFQRKSSCPCWPSTEKYAPYCLVYQLSVAAPGFESLIGHIENRDMFPVSHDRLLVDKTPRPHLHDFNSCMAAFERELVSMNKQGHLPFSLLFQVEALVWGNYLHPASALGVLVKMKTYAEAAKQSKQALPFTVESVKKVFQNIPYPEPGIEAKDLRPRKLVAMAIDEESELCRDNPFRDNEYGATLPSNQAWVTRAMITPTRIVLRGPEPESKNQILRMYPKNTDCFLRVLFCDEDGQDLAFKPSVSYDAIFERWMNLSNKGFEIARRRFSYLGQSHSALRSHSAWFAAPFTDQNLRKQDHHTIIDSFGHFEDIRVIAKCAARIGQAFSETPYSLNIFEAGISRLSIEDVKSPDGKRIFSDGVGTISRAALEEIWPKLPLKQAPTCLQIRLGGIKGMLSLDSTWPGKVIRIRKESMMKFPSKDLSDLGICGSASKPLRMVLNRQVIKIMEDLGTPDDWFFTIQRRALQTLREVTASASNTSKFLQQQSVGDNMGLPRFIKSLDNMGIDYRKDAFLKSAVEHVVLRELRLLKRKARIPVEKGVTLFGVMDEFGYLEPDVIYVTFEHGWRGIEVPRKPCRAIVTRCPALHPGDVREVTMITRVPTCHPLADLRNCVVFSQKGDRDIPSQLSGGDLDGDLYNIIWDKDAMTKRTDPPADYPRASPEELDRAVTRKDRIQHFFDFFKSDVLGLIAVRHQILADVRPQGTLDPGCITLAELHSTAVDFSKTGIAVDKTEIPRAPRTRPDFLALAPPLVTYDLGQIAHIGEEEDAEDEDDEDMGETKYRYHRSEKILGKLYRAVDEKVVWEEAIHREIGGTTSLWTDLFEAVFHKLGEHKIRINYQQYLEEAWRIRGRYEGALVGMTWQFSESSRTHLPEVEAFCGIIQNKRGIQTRRQLDSSIKLREEMDRVTAWVVKMIRGTDPDDDQTAIMTSRRHDKTLCTLELCMACLSVGCVKSRKASYLWGEDNTNLQSFRVIAAACLLSELSALPEKEKVTSGGYIGVALAGLRKVMTLPVR